MIKNIIFDLGGVLLNLDFPRCIARFKALGIGDELFTRKKVDDNQPKGATLCEGMTASGDSDLYQVGGISTENFLLRIQKACIPGTSVEDVLDAWNSCLLDIPQYKLELLKQLKAEGYKVYMLSNTNDAHWTKIANDNFPEPLDTYFDGIFLSHELKLAKPNPAIYKAVVEYIGAKEEECIFIDDAQVNCDAATAIGIRSQKYEIGSLLQVKLD